MRASTVLSLLLAVLAMAMLADPPAPVRGPAFALTTDGAMTLQSDREGAAILQADGLRPGTMAEGVVTLSATGRNDVALVLARTDGPERPGTGGGRLSDRLVLAIDDITAPAAPVAVYTGRLADLRELALTALPGGVQRRYRFRAWFPRGAGDDAYQDAALTTGFLWTGTDTGGTGTPGGPARPEPTPPAGGGGTGGGGRTVPGTVPATPTPPAGGSGGGTVPGGTTPATGTGALARLTGLPKARRCVKRKRYRVRARPAPGVRVTSVAAYVDKRRQRGRHRGRTAFVDLRTARRARTRVRVVVSTSAGRVTFKARYRLCR